MSEKLQAFLKEQNTKKSRGSLLGSSGTNSGNSSAAEGDSDTSKLLSWVPSVSISMPKVFSGAEKQESSNSNWFSEASSDPICPALSRKQRLIGFAVCVFTGIMCFSLAAMYAPLLVLKARKFSLLYSLGSLFMINSFSFLWGPWIHMKHLFTKDRLPFTIAYFGSLFATLYFAMWLRSTVLTVVAAVVQIIALTWYIVSYIPGGQAGLRFISSLFTSLVSRTCRKTISV